MLNINMWWNKNKAGLKKLSFWILKTLVISAIVIMIGYKSLPSLWIMAFQKAVNEAVRIELTDVNRNVQFILDYIRTEQTFLIQYASEQIKQCYEPVTIFEIERILTYWKDFPSEWKTPPLEEKFAVILQWYKKEIGS